MVISEWIKICGKNYNPNIKGILDYSAVFYEAWGRFGTIDKNENFNEAKLISVIGVKKNIRDGIKFTGYVFDEACAKTKDQEYSYYYTNNKNYNSSSSIYEVALLCDIETKQKGFDIKSLSYKLDGDYV